MKLKELKKTVNVCWSPAEHYPVMIAAGSAAQQVDESFSSSSFLELYSLNLDHSGLDLGLKASLQTEHKFQKIVWSGSEIIVGGCDGGLLQFYSSEKLLQGAPDCLLSSSTKHTGDVSALDVNPYQKNLLASAASESEIFIWDLNNTSQPMAPGNRSQPYEHVQAVAWNQQVQHILGSTFATRCVVWDLRKNEPIMKLSDSQARTRWRSVAWHPEVATQLCIASEDDHLPVVQLWDLRLAASPLLSLAGHQKAVTSLSWSRHEPDLLLSAGVDGRLLCWNPNDAAEAGGGGGGGGGSMVLEVESARRLVAAAAWCPRDPALLLAAGSDLLTVHSLLGGSPPETSVESATNIMESFGAASFRQLPAVARASLSAPPPAQPPAPPRWLRRPARARFAFGGKLVTFEKCPAEAGSQKLVYISQVAERAVGRGAGLAEGRGAGLQALLAATLSAEPDAPLRLADYCRERGDAATDQGERLTWFFLRAHFLPTFKEEALNLLGFKQDEIPSKFKNANVGDASQPDLVGLSRGESTETEAELSTDTSTDVSDAHTLIERKLDNLDLETEVANIVIPNGEDATSLICRALVCGNIEEAVELCLAAKRIPDAMVVAALGGPELVSRVQRYYLCSSRREPVALVCWAALGGRWAGLVRAAAPACWPHALAALLAHCPEHELPLHAETLGDRLANESDPALREAATICYVAGMCPEALGRRWRRAPAASAAPGDPGAGAASAAELALLARRAAIHRGRDIQAGGALEGILVEQAWRLAGQGRLEEGLAALQAVQHAELRDRIRGALGQPPGDTRAAAAHPQQQYVSRARTASTHSQKGHYGHNNANLYSSDQGYESAWVTPPYPPQPGAAPALPPQPPLPAPPPRPPSAGPTGGLSSRPKYKLDPSVQPPLPPLHPVSSQPSYGYNSPLPDPYQANSFAPINPVNPANIGFNQASTGFNQASTGFNQASTGFNQASTGFNQASTGFNQASTGFNQANSGYNPAVNGSYYAPPEPAQAPVASKPVPPGWNDPPMMSSKTKPKQEVQAQAPITHPLFGTEPPQHVPLNPVPGQQYSGQQYPGQQYPGQQYPGQEYPGQQYPVQQYPPQQFPGQYDQQGMGQGYQQQPTEPAGAAAGAPGAAEAPAPVQKAPLPEEHLVLQSVFDNLREQCVEKAVNPQMKRKLEDVQRRLELLYDMLREYKLSEGALQCLHRAAQLAGGGDYGGAAGAATALASGADFSSAAAFLPALRGLLQLAAQLHVPPRPS